jgi:hypothetical protein
LQQPGVALGARPRYGFGVSGPIVAQATAAVCLLCLAACSSPNHDILAVRDRTDAGAAGAARDGSVHDADLDAPADQGTQPPDDASKESAAPPDGPSVFTFVHGLVDVRAVRVCFEVHRDGGNVMPAVVPVPDSPSGLPFGHSFAGAALAGGIDLQSDDVTLVVLSGDMDAMSGHSCDQLSSPPSGVSALRIATLPAGTLAHQRSVLMVAAGCVGGATHDDPSSDNICGSGYSPTTPSAQLLVATMMRSPVADAIGMQAFGAVLGSPQLSLRFLNAASFTVTLAYGVPTGVIAPKPPSTSLTRSTVDPSPQGDTLQINDPSGSTPVATIPLLEALKRGGLAESEFVDGRNYTAVWVGARAGVPAGPWWQSFAITIVRSDP